MSYSHRAALRKMKFPVVFDESPRTVAKGNRNGTNTGNGAQQFFPHFSDRWARTRVAKWLAVSLATINEHSFRDVMC